MPELTDKCTVKVLAACLLVLNLICSDALGQDPPDSTSLEGRPPDEMAITFVTARHSSLDAISVGYVMEWTFAGGKLGFGGEAPMVKVIRQNDNDDKYRLTGDYAVMAAIALPSAAAMWLFGDSSLTSKIVMGALSPLGLPVLHPKISLRPVNEFRLCLGYDAEYDLFTAEDGIWFHPYVGVELRPNFFLHLQVAARYNALWSFDRESRGFGWGWHAQLMFSINHMPSH